MYKKEEKENALKLYEEVKSVKKVIQQLGYPTREGLYKWLRDSKNPPDKTKAPRRRINNSPEHSLHPPPELKLETIRRCFERGEVVHRTILLARVSSVDLRMNFFMVVIGQITRSTTSFRLSMITSFGIAPTTKNPKNVIK